MAGYESKNQRYKVIKLEIQNNYLKEMLEFGPILL
jgi:hypothetical protein